jgi:outer membrane receptor protein involved in Fe transport
MSPRKPKSLPFTLLLSLTFGGAVVAQTVPPPATAATNSTEPVIELSPFVTTETSNTGWIATETLAGTRLRTDLKDVPNQIETLTKDFMADLGVTDMNQALIYTANVENSTDYMRATPGQQVINPEMGGRVRGIGSGTLSRNFFQVSNPTDNFNIERATVASGPNAILFGLGSGAGILDATPAQALLNRNKYGFALQYDSEYSKRGTVDANVVLLKDKLAVRVMGLSKTEYTDKRPNHDRDDRLYAAVTFKPFKNTKLILEGEKDNRSWNIASRVAPVDAVTPWLNANRTPPRSTIAARSRFPPRISSSVRRRKTRC